MMPGRSAATFTALLITNGGVLLVLLFGPNGQHPMSVVSYLGAALALGGVIAIVRSAVMRRRQSSSPPTKAI